MSDLTGELVEKIFTITLNRIHKHNAFDDLLLNQLQGLLDEAIANPDVRVIVLKANGKYFSAGADADWMQRMVAFDEKENIKDALILARLMNTLYQCPKPTLAVVQGAAFGGGAGLVAACDIGIACHEAYFCFSEAKLGLIPAVISPYVIKAIGERAAKWLFMSAETIDAARAYELQLVQYCVNVNELDSFARQCAQNMAELAPQAVPDCKALVNNIAGRDINESLLQETARIIAKKRVSKEGQQGLAAFLARQKPKWD